MNEGRRENIVFILMPFVKELDPVHASIVMAVNQVGAGLQCIRADEDTQNKEILKGIVNRIASSRLVIADLSFANPNVLYELGTAHAFRKPTILILQKGMEAPFDVKPYRYVEYTPTNEGLDGLRLKLREQVREIISLDQNKAVSNPVTDGLSDENRKSLYPDTWPGLVAYLARKFRPWQQFVIALLVLIIGGAGGVGLYSLLSTTTTQSKSGGVTTEEANRLRGALKENETSLSEAQESNKFLLSENSLLREQLKQVASSKNIETTKEVAELSKVLKKRDADLAQLQNINKELQARNAELGLKLKKEGLARADLEKDLVQLQLDLITKRRPEDVLQKVATPSEIQRAYKDLVSLRKKLENRSSGYAANLGEVSVFNQYLLFAQRRSKVEEIKEMKTLVGIVSNSSLLAAIDGLLVALRLNYNLE